MQSLSIKSAYMQLNDESNMMEDKQQLLGTLYLFQTHISPNNNAYSSCMYLCIHSETLTLVLGVSFV